LTTFCAYFLWIFEVSNFEKLLLTWLLSQNRIYSESEA
jgi:hypothetical protein